MIEEAGPELEESPPQREETQFSLAELFGLTLFAAVLFTGFQWLPPSIFAMILGVATCIGLLLLWLLKIERSSIRIAWWILLATYLTASYFAVRRVQDAGANPAFNSVRKTAPSNGSSSEVE